MSVRAAIVLGVFLVVAALAHGGIWTAGHDFVVNRFTGTWEFVPADDVADEGDVQDVRSCRTRVRRPRLDLFRTGG